MSADSYFTHPMKGEFKRKIHYPALALKSQAHKRVNMDWIEVLTEFKDGRGEVWRGRFQKPYIQPFGLGVLTGSLKSGNKEFSIFITSFLTDDWKARLDYVVDKLSVTSMTDINAQVVQSQADIYFVTKTPGPVICNFILANFHVEIAAKNFEDVTVLAQAVIAAMHAHSENIPSSEPSKFTVAPSRYRTPINKAFSLAVSGLAMDWMVTQPDLLLPDDIKLTDDDKNVFTFNATAVGKIAIPIVAMNRHTLTLSDQWVEVIIE